MYIYIIYIYMYNIYISLINRSLIKITTMYYNQATGINCRTILHNQKMSSVGHNNGKCSQTYTPMSLKILKKTRIVTFQTIPNYQTQQLAVHPVNVLLMGFVTQTVRWGKHIIPSTVGSSQVAILAAKAASNPSFCYMICWEDPVFGAPAIITGLVRGTTPRGERKLQLHLQAGTPMLEGLSNKGKTLRRCC